MEEAHFGVNTIDEGVVFKAGVLGELKLLRRGITDGNRQQATDMLNQISDQFDFFMTVGTFAWKVDGADG